MKHNLSANNYGMMKNTTAVIDEDAEPRKLLYKSINTQTNKLYESLSLPKMEYKCCLLAQCFKALCL